MATKKIFVFRNLILDTEPNEERCLKIASVQEVPDNAPYHSQTVDFFPEELRPYFHDQDIEDIQAYLRGEKVYNVAYIERPF